MVRMPLMLTGLMMMAIVPAQAQTAEELTTAMNNSELCAPFKIGLKELASLVGYDIPDLVPDAEIGVDKNHHNVEAYSLTGDQASINGTVACEPSDQGVPFKDPFNLDPAALRASDKFSCTAMVANQTASNMQCTTSGEIGKVLVKYVDLNGGMTTILNDALK